MVFRPNAENDWTRWVVSTTATAVMILKPDLEVVGFILGALCNAVTTKILKKIINAERPKSSVEAGNDSWRGPGMPSSHASSLFFFATYLTATAYYYQPQTQTQPRGWTPPLYVFGSALYALIEPFLPRALSVACAAPDASVHAWHAFAAAFDVFAVVATRWRVPHLHTTAQVIVGACVGLCGGVFHYFVGMPFARTHAHAFGTPLIPPPRALVRRVAGSLISRVATDDVWWGWAVAIVIGIFIIGAITLERTIQRAIRLRFCPPKDKSNKQ